MNFRQKITLHLLLYITLCGTASAQVVEIPDHNLQAAVRHALGDENPTEIRMRQLTILEAGNQGIIDLSGLEHATNLTRLILHGNPISDLTPISNLTKMEHLDIAICSISDLTALSNLVNLKYLYAQINLIADVGPLSRLTNLVLLQLDSNRVRDVTPLAGLTNLVDLSLSKNRIRDVTPLAGLTQLTHLYLTQNHIFNHSPLDSLRLSHFEYDETCEMPPLPLQPRLENRTYPSVAARWSGYGWPPVRNRPDLSDAENIALHDLWFHGDELGLRPRDVGGRTVLTGNLDLAIQRREELLSLNPNLVILMSLHTSAADFDAFPEDSPYWIRYPDGTIFRNHTHDGRPKPYWLVDYTHPDIQYQIVEQAIAVLKCGLYDGIFFDTWSEVWPILSGFDANGGFHVFKSLEEELQARLNIVQRIRAQTRPDFLIMGNVNDNIIPLTGPYLNGGFMEVGTPEADSMLKLEAPLTWLESNLREPRINALEGGIIPGESADSPINLRWMRAFTTLGLTHSDGYVRFEDRVINNAYWYDFWDADLGRPVGEKGQLYQGIDGLYIREFTNGWAVYNHSDEAQVITLPEEAQGVASGLVNTEHALPNRDGEMYLKKTAPMESPDMESTEIIGSDIYIAEPIHAVPGATLLLDASNNPGTTARWVNLGTAGGRLLASDRLPSVEEGEIEIPSIGFSGQRRYYTATASGETFGGPVQRNPQLYLGDWTLEFLCKRNGNLFDLEHQFAGFQNTPREGLQGIRLRLLIDGRELELSVHADGFKQPTKALNIFLEENVWTWVTIVSINGESIIAYQDGVEVSRHPGVNFDPNLPIDDISIGANSFDERHRNFNGSFSIVRVYDSALSPDEVLQNIGATMIPIANPADVNGDGVVNILDLVVVAQGFGKDGLQGDVNGDGVVNVFDLVQVAGAIGGGGAAPSAYSLDTSIISAADVERWLAGAQGLDIGDANLRRGIRFLEQLLAALTPKETMLLPNYPNPFNPETWIPYHLAREAEVAITIYDTKGTLVRRLALGNQAAGHYAEHGKAAYWDGRNEGGEAVASGIYIYQFRAGDYAASRRMVIVK